MFSCSSINKNSENQSSSEVKKVKPLAPISSVVQESDLLSNTTPTSRSDLKAKKEITGEDIFQNRNLSKYDEENTADCSTYKCVQRKMRNFIWAHWQNKKRGYIKNHLAGIDVSIADHIFIEPDEEGNWKVTWKIITNHSISEYSKFEETVGEVSIKKVKGSSEKLLFKGESGEILREL